MTDYVKITDFAAKDALTTGNPAKLVKGVDIGAEFDAIAVSVASKADEDGATLVNVDINSGTIDGAIIGASSPAAITGTTITGTALAGPHNGTVGAVTPAAITGTTITGTTITANTGFVGALTGSATQLGGVAAAGYLLVDGSSSMTGDLNFATDKNISVGGVDILAITSTGTAPSTGKTLTSNIIPVSSTATTLVAADAGNCVSISAGITVPANIFSAGHAVSVYNNTAGALTITQGADLTLRKAASAVTGNQTISQRGIATIWFLSTTEAIATGVA